LFNVKKTEKDKDICKIADDGRHAETCYTILKCCITIDIHGKQNNKNNTVQNYTTIQSWSQTLLLSDSCRFVYLSPFLTRGWLW
jgi:hypothetical protein